MDAQREAASRGIKLDPNKFYPQLWQWGFGQPGIRGVIPGWHLGLTLPGIHLVDLVTSVGPTFDKAVDFLIKLDLAFFGYEIGAVIGGGIGGVVGGGAGGETGPGTEPAPEPTPTPEPEPTPTPVVVPPVPNPNPPGEVTNPVTGGIGGLTGGATSGLGDILNEITSGLGDLLGGIKDTIGGLVSTVSDTFHSVSDTIKSVNEDLIKPITGPIVSIMENYKALQAGLARDLHSGIGGLLRVPTDIANAMSSVDATMQRTVSMLGAQNAALVANQVVPGLASAGSVAMDQTRAAIATGLDEYGSDERDHHIKHIHENPEVEDLDRLANIILGVLKGEYGWAGRIAGTAIDVLMMMASLLIYQEPKNEAYHQIGRRKWPTTPLEIADALAAMRRGILSREDATYELGGHGLNPDRIATLEALERLLPADDAVLDWKARGILDVEGVTQVLTAKGWREDDIARLITAHKRLPDIAQAISWYHRGGLGISELYDVLRAFDLREADIARTEEASWLLPGAADVFTYIDRKAAIVGNDAPISLNTEPEDAVIEALKQIGIPRRTADMLWVNHFQLLPPALAVIAWFRRYINLNQLEGFLGAAGIAKEQWQNFIDLQRPLLPARSIPAYIAAGVVTEGEGMDMIRAQGYDEVTAKRIIDFALHKAHATTAKVAGELHGLTVSTVTDLYKAGSLPAAQALSMLIELGHSTEAAHLELQLIDIRQLHAERQGEAALIVAQALAGSLSFEQAQAELSTLGLSATELAKYTTQIHKLLQARTKLPSEAQVLGMYKHLIIERTDAAATLHLMGYSDVWTERLIKLEEAGHGPAPAPRPVAPGP